MKMGWINKGFSFAFAPMVLVALALLWKPNGVIALGSSSDGTGRRATLSSTEPASADRSASAQETAKVPTAGDAYMNIQVLKDIPSDQLVPSMKYISTVLGVRCDFCHDPKSFENDDKTEKTTARNMMKMMFAINKDNFNGRREVTCYTCHHGASHAANIPSLYAASMTNGLGVAAPASSAAVPTQPSGGASGGTAAAPTVTLDEIIAKYTDALGGAAAVAKVTSLDAKGIIELPFNGGMKAQAEELRKAPDKAAVLVRLPNGSEFAQGYNGTAGWRREPGHEIEDLKGDDLVRAKTDAAFIPGLNLKQGFSRAQVAAIDKIGDRQVYRVVAVRQGGGQVRFYFDAQSGLLLRVSERIESALGALPQDTDFSDYRDVNGIKVPFIVTEMRVEGPSTFKWEQIQANTTIDDARFEKPAEKSAEKPAQP